MKSLDHLRIALVATDGFENASARWIDRACVSDGQLVTSRGPQDLPTFNQEIANAFAAAGARAAVQGRPHAGPPSP
ncbi:DJ-1/PfpI family protein [Ramlibacter tataouinensis]|uniref:DJ-1/PfpI family protein n=1 Tax=Ramlibacter tataouinensis TaxID=94132 RepID=UPI0005A234C4|nr:DJ-1/PfpI family protein [Ramlibacter tataouinensis]